MKAPKNRGFVGVEIAIALAIIAVLAVAGVGSYVAYHSRMTASESATTTPVTAMSTDTGSATTQGTGAGTRVITGDDANSVIHMHVGDTFVLKLGTDKNWTGVRVSDTSIISPVETFAAIPGAQGMYEARAKGTATITASGSAICDPGMACPQFILAYKVTIVVD